MFMGFAPIGVSENRFRFACSRSVGLHQRDWFSFISTHSSMSASRQRTNRELNLIGCGAIPPDTQVRQVRTAKPSFAATCFAVSNSRGIGSLNGLLIGFLTPGFGVTGVLIQFGLPEAFAPAMKRSGLWKLPGRNAPAQFVDGGSESLCGIGD